MTHKNDFLRKGPAGLVVVPLLFALVTLALLVVMFKVFAAPYYSLVEWFMETSVVETQPKDLFDEAAQTLTNTENDPPPALPFPKLQKNHIPGSSLLPGIQAARLSNA